MFQWRWLNTNDFVAEDVLYKNNVTKFAILHIFCSELIQLNNGSV